MYKNELQELAQRSCFNLPSYTCIREGPDHAPRFKAAVNFNGEIFECPLYCSTLCQAEHSAAEVALNSLSHRGPSPSLAARILSEDFSKRFNHPRSNHIASTNNFAKAASTSRPPRYAGTDYNYWKVRMRNYLLAVDIDAYLVITRGPKIPMKKNASGQDVPKPEDEWERQDFIEASLNARALNYLFCAIDRSQINKLSEFSNAHELWKSLEMINEGTSQIKESKINRLMCDLDNFKMEDGEEVESMISRFTMIINNLSALGKSISTSDQVKKILRSLPKEYRICTATIKEFKDLNTLQLDDLVGKLLEFEMDIKKDLREEASKNKKNLTLKSRAKIVVSSSDESSRDSDEENELLAKNFKKFFKLKVFNKKREKECDRSRKHKKERVTCYKCQKPGHMANECSLRKSKSKSKKKAMKMTNLALMAIEDELMDAIENNNILNSSNDSEEDEVCNSSEFNELHTLYDSLKKKHKKLDNEYSLLSHDHASLLGKMESYEKELACLKDENISLKANYENCEK